MPRERIILSPTAQDLLGLVKTGRLREIQEWVRKGNSLRLPELKGETSALNASVKTGFYTLVEFIVQNEEWGATELSSALNTASLNHRPDLADLLINAGASARYIRFEEACRTMNGQLIERLLEAGADPDKHNAFAQVLNDHKAKPLLGIYRGLREKFPALDRQAALALSEAVKQRNLRWTSLLAWAGANPLESVPSEIYEEWPEDNDYSTNAALRACMGDDVAILRSLRIKPNEEQLRELLHYAAFRPHVEIIDYLLKLSPDAALNEPDTQSSKALESLVKDSKDRTWGWSNNVDREKHILESSELLLNRGARWNPANNDVTYSRRGLGTQDPKHVVQLVRLLLYTQGAANPLSVWELCRTPKIRDLIRKADLPLWNELLTISPD